MEIDTEYLEKLNENQRKAVEAINGPVLVLAGAGTGKTSVLTTRIAHLINTGTAMPHQILAVTFTNKASQEMIARVNNLVPAQGLWLGTFHSVAARILRIHAELAGLQNNFSIINTDDQLRFTKNLMKDNNIDDKKYPPKVILSIIQRWKDLALGPESISGSDIKTPAHNIAKSIYQSYQKRMQTLNAADFGDLLLLCIKIFTEHPDVLAEYQMKFRFIMVDEYQDTNIAQYLWLRLLAGMHKNICCVGDEDQSIYGWRGAEIGNILKFEKDFPGAKIVRLEQNYRSTNNILNSASSLIANNSERLGKHLWTDIGDGEKIKIASLWDEREEANFISRTIENFRRQGTDLKNMAILVRASFQTRAFEECFINNAIAYKVVGGLRFYERLEIRDVIAYIRIANQLNDSLALERIINVPKRSIGVTTLNQIAQHAGQLGVSLFEAIKDMLNKDLLKSRVKAPLQTLTNSIESWNKRLASENHVDVAEDILNESGYLNMWEKEKTPEAQGRVENIKELLLALREFESITEFLDHVSLVTDNDNAKNDSMVNIMTLHAAKGLEFDTLFLPGWEEGVFPHQKALDEEGGKGLEEERRLAYVGITRAKRNLFITYAISRKIYGQWQSSIPSRFIAELPEECIEKLQVNNGLNHPPTSNFVAAKKQDTSGFKLGKRVFHDKFGYGFIIGINGENMEISFDKAGIKKIVKKFLELV